MRRRAILTRSGLVGAVSLAGCIGSIFGTVPKEFKVRNDRDEAAEVLVTIIGDDREVFSKRYRLASGQIVSEKWPDVGAETYTIVATVDGFTSAFTFDPADWSRRHTPVVRIFETGVDVEV
ncbi:hypothetical protein [Halomarina pelagica]|uniref:hypothetical protein n=1 Tax=Halomarina pelagica TaxID=2961599 RepID=UPI0020C58BF9|nr:hypothetical protein [Halomarina sp. BND7]